MDEVIDLLVAARGYIEESLRLQNEENIEGSLTMLREAVSCMATYRTEEKERKDLIDVLNAIKGHDLKLLGKKVVMLKQTDGEGWAVGEMLQRAIEWYAVRAQKEVP